MRKYVEGIKEPTQLLDLLAAAGSDDIEPTRAVAGRQALYPDVGVLTLFSFCSSCFNHVSSISLPPLWLLVSKLVNCTKDISMPTNITTWRFGRDV